MAQSAPFKLLLAAVADALKDRGYRRSGKILWRSSNEGWAIVEFQRSTKSSADVTTFTVNLGTASKALCRFFGRPETVPSFEECHWKQRIGFALPTAEDRWWHLAGSDVSGVTSEVVEALIRYGLPVVEAHMSDESLKEEWMSGHAPGITETDRLKYLSALLKVRGELSESAAVGARLEESTAGRPTAGLAEMHLRKLASENHGA